MAVEQATRFYEILIRFEDGEVKGAHVILENFVTVDGAVVHKAPGQALPVSALKGDKHLLVLETVLGKAVAEAMTTMTALQEFKDAAETKLDQAQAEVEFIRKERDFYAEVVARASKKAEETPDVPSDAE